MAANVSFFIVNSDIKVGVGGHRLALAARKTDCSAVLTFRAGARGEGVSGGVRVWG